MNTNVITLWIKKRKWDILFGIFVGLILFVPSIRMPVLSTIQRWIALSPTELAEKDQRKISSTDWELLDLENSAIHFSESTGKITIVNLWATWCPPCIAEMPALQNLYNKYKDDVAFYFVSNEDPETLRRFVAAKKYELPIFTPLSRYPKDFESNSLPTTYVLDQNGKIIIIETGAHDWFSKKFQQKIEDLLAAENK